MQSLFSDIGKIPAVNGAKRLPSAIAAGNDGRRFRRIAGLLIKYFKNADGTKGMSTASIRLSPVGEARRAA